MAAVIEGTDETILFDTGGDGQVLLSNMHKIGIDPKEIDSIVISHIHADHTGALWAFLEANPAVTVYIPASFSSSFTERVEQYGSKAVRVKGVRKICPHVFSTGELGSFIKEQSLVIFSSKGPILITGCSHPGIDTIAEKAGRISNQDIYLVTGGFHLGSTSEQEINQIIERLKSLGVQKIAPSHCTGERAINLFKEAWREDFIKAGCGARLFID